VSSVVAVSSLLVPLFFTVTAAPETTSLIRIRYNAADRASRCRLRKRACAETKH
jgi:hypothetical protein